MNSFGSGVIRNEQLSLYLQQQTEEDKYTNFPQFHTLLLITSLSKTNGPTYKPYLRGPGMHYSK